MNHDDVLLFGSACRIAGEIRSRRLSSTEAVERSLAQIERVNPAINAAVQVVRERAREEAGRLDQLAAEGTFAGPLHGVPISIKDSLDTAGVVSTGGTMGRKRFVPQQDAPVVARLRAAGAILVAKTNTPELTLSAETGNLIYGRTSNPWDHSRSPGGSSGGAAALVAAGGAALDLGSDTGGSIREPAHLCGIAGIKPTSGRTPRSGHIIPGGMGVLDSLTQIGPMARYVEDLALTLPMICGPDGRDPGVVPAIMGDVADIDVNSLKIAVYTDNGVIRPCDDICRVVEEVASALDREGLPVEMKLLPDMPYMVELMGRLRQAANGRMITRLLERYGTTEADPTLMGYFEQFDLGADAEIELELLEEIDTARTRALRFLSRYDAILCPPSHDLARPHGASLADGFETWSHVTLYNLLGWPGATVRAGTSADGELPVGVQVVAAPWREDIALALASKIESLCHGFHPPPLP